MSLNALQEHRYSNEPGDISLADIVHIIWRHKHAVWGVSAIFLVLSSVFLWFQTPRYTANAVIQINFRPNKIVDFENVVSGISYDDIAIQSELDILKSRYLASKVIKKLELIDDPEFSPNIEDKAPDSVAEKAVFKEQVEHKNATYISSEQAILTQTIDRFLKHTQFSRRPKSYTIDISFSSQSPQKAALIANSIAEEYLAYQLSEKFDTTKRASGWLNEKIANLQAELYQSEIAVQEFQKKHDLVETAGSTVNDQQLSGLNTQLILASAARAEAEARLHSAEDSIDSSFEVLGSSLMHHLRKQESAVLQKRADLSTRYGPKHPKMIHVNAKLNDLRVSITAEVEKIKDSLRKELDIAKTREGSLKRSIRTLQRKVGNSSEARVQLSELMRQMNAKRLLYESFLTRSKEIVHDQDLKQADTRIISPAERPLFPSFPQKILLLVIMGLTGSGFGIVLTFLIEHLDNRIRTVAQLQRVAGIIPIALIPKLHKKLASISHKLDSLPFSYLESLRSVFTDIYLSSHNHTPKSILVTSSISQEGKTTLAVSLASIAALSGKKILLIDGDFSKATLSAMLPVKKERSITGYVNGSANKESLIHIDKTSGLHLVFSQKHAIDRNPTLWTQKIHALIDWASKQYDLVIIDSAAITESTDSIALAKMVDAVLLTVRWNRTLEASVRTAIALLKSKNITPLSTVFSHTDLKRYHRDQCGNIKTS